MCFFLLCFNELDTGYYTHRNMEFVECEEMHTKLFAHKTKYEEDYAIKQEFNSKLILQNSLISSSSPIYIKKMLNSCQLTAKVS